MLPLTPSNDHINRVTGNGVISANFIKRISGFKPAAHFNHVYLLNLCIWVSLALQIGLLIQDAVTVGYIFGLSYRLKVFEAVICLIPVLVIYLLVWRQTKKRLSDQAMYPTHELLGITGKQDFAISAYGIEHGLSDAATLRPSNPSLIARLIKWKLRYFSPMLHVHLMREVGIGCIGEYNEVDR